MKDSLKNKKALKLLLFILVTIILLLGYIKLGQGYLTRIFIFFACSLIGMIGVFLDKECKKMRFVISAANTFLFIYLFIYNIVRINFGFPFERILGDVISIILATNTDEITSFIKNFSSYDYLKASYPIIGLILLWYGNSINDSIKVTYRRFKMLCVASIMSFIGLIIIPNFTFSNLIKNIPIFYDEIIYSLNYVEEKNKFVWNAKSNIKGSSTVVVIIGETTRGDHMSLNGYYRQTTPNLLDEDIISFKKAISIGSHTLASTPYIFTRKPVEDKWARRLFPEKSFISAFKEAGYVTYYVSYLNKIHVGDNAINQIVSEADNYIKRDGKYDEYGIPIIERILKNDNSEKKLIIYKLIGSHYHFQDRYPKEFAMFQPSFTERNFNGLNVVDKQVFINTYDNSIIYTDYVVSTILKRLKQLDGDVTLSFISDHGISIFEDNKTIYHATKKANYNIPLFFWFNDTAQKRLGDAAISDLKSKTNRLVDQSYFCDTVMDINGIEIEKYNKSLLRVKNFDEDLLVIQGPEVVKYSSIEGTLAN